MYLLSFLLLIVTCSSENCSETLAMKRSCIFYYDYPNSDCNNSSFRQCSYKYSDERRFSFKDQGTCLKICCGLQDGEFTSTSISECRYKEQNGYQGLLNGIIMFFIALCIALSFIFYGLCEDFRRKRRQELMAQIQQQAIRNVDQPQLNEQQTGYSQKTQTSIEKSYFYVCFKKSVSVQLECQHTFHRKCIASTINRKKSIGCCDKQNQRVKLFCEKCFKFMSQRAISSITTPFWSLPSICESCKQLKQ